MGRRGEQGSSEGSRGDAVLVAGALTGDPSSVERLTQRLMVVPRMLREINRRLGAPLTDHDVEDLSQDALIQIWKKLQRFGDDGTLDPWLYRFCQLEFMNRRRKLFRRRDRDLAIAQDAQDRASSAPNSDDGTDRLEAALGALSDRDRRVLHLRHGDGLTFPAIGQQLGEAEEAVKGRYYRALQTLRKRLIQPPLGIRGEELKP